MTTIPGHNQIIQQSGIAQEISNQAHALKPSPDQAAVVQQAQEKRKNSTVLESDESERLKKKREERQKQQKRQKQQDMDMDPDAPGRILDTTV